MNRKAFTLIELLVVVAIIGILAAVGVVAYDGYVKSAKCVSSKIQHKQVLRLAQTTYQMCFINGYTYMNSPPGLTCRSNTRSGMTKISGDGFTNKCVKKWDCKSDWLNRRQTAGLSSGYFFDHARAEFNQPIHTGGFARNDQWQNFLKYNYPDRPGITNIREKDDNMHIATFLGEDCSGGNFTNSSGGTYLVDEFIWP